MNHWNIEQARKTYNVLHWSNGYFDINDKGHLVARPTRQQASAEIDIYTLSDEIKQSGLSLPVLVRFTDILHDRVTVLGNAFRQAMIKNNYQGEYTSVYPIKVNQQRSVVDEILNVTDEHVGLEAGSKPELMVVLALSQKKDSIIICNGYKDREYIRLALIGKQLDNKVYIVIEKISELELIIKEAKDLNIQPLIGIRIRLASIGTGLWQNTGGEKSKFGLSATQVLSVIERLKKVNLLNSLELLHFHMGSQLPNIRDIQNGLNECARYYAEFHRLGAHIRCIDVGGGLGINYDGTRSRNFCSMNYDINEYATSIINTFSNICSENALPHPDIITESGRALTAHHAVLITNVVEAETVNQHVPEKISDDIFDDIAEKNIPPAIQDLIEKFNYLSEHQQDKPKPGENNSNYAPIEIYHDTTHSLSDIHTLYVQGKITLKQRACAEQYYFALCWKIRTLLQASTKTHRDALDELNEKLADKYFCNFSIFQSIPDVWAISQIFPIVPLHRLDEAPERRGRIHDITCDSDGRIDNYVDGEGVESSLPLHSVKANEPYLLGIFLVGAYQEILGDMHNLFGDTDSVNVVVHSDGKYNLEQALPGDTVKSVLQYVRYDTDDMVNAYLKKINAAELSNVQ
ncbi:MAG: biosynthetic arginine decarboxylase, partial [Gammaproteobacteria bacterium]|nr:biosynthetic arginine decarboxylase [Gammaproteobacteria bacterium]